MRLRLSPLSFSKPPATLTALTFNVFTGPPTPTAHAGTLDGSDRLRRQVEAIADIRPDIVCLQEVLSDGVRQFYEQGLNEEYSASYVLTQDEFRCRAGRMMRMALDHIGPQT